MFSGVVTLVAVVTWSVMVACTRIALHNICLGRLATEYTGDARVAELGGADVGFTHHFTPEIIQILHSILLAKLSLRGRSDSCSRFLPGLGIPSDLEVLADGGTPDHFHGRKK